VHHLYDEIVTAIAALGVGGIGASFFDRRHATSEAQKARDHASQEARAIRLFEARFEAYKAASIHLERFRQFAEWTEPVMGPMPEPPDLKPDETFTTLSGIVAITLSDAVRDAMQATTNTGAAFIYFVQEYRDTRDRPGTSWDPSDARSPREKMDEARQDVFNAITLAQDAMRDELANL
jgi:hypothetical protein